MGFLTVVAITGLLAYLPGGQLDPSTVAVAYELERNYVVYFDADHDHQQFHRLIGLRQWIIWEQYQGERHVRCWRIEKQGDMVVRLRGKWRLFVEGGADVVADVYRPTWTTIDVETADRDVYPREERLKALRGWQQ